MNFLATVAETTGAFVAAFFSATLLLLVVVLATAMPIVIGWAESESGRQSWPSVVGLGAGLLLAHPFGVALARLALRLFPVNAHGGRRYGVLAASGVTTAVSLAALVLAAPPSIQLDLGGSGFVAVVAPSIAALLLAGAALFRVHVTPESYLRSPFILYLRRFSTLSDRSTLAGILRASPRGVPVLFIASPGNKPRNWDLFVWAFAGLRWVRPWSSLPIHVRSSEQGWKSYVEGMITQAGAVVIDVSGLSNSLRLEVQMLNRAQGRQRFVWICAAREADGLDWDAIGVERPARLLRYDTTYGAAIPGLLFKLYLFALPMILFLSLLGVDKENPQGVPWTSVKGPLAIAAAMLVALYLLVYTRPAITRRSQRAIHAALLNGLSLNSKEPE